MTPGIARGVPCYLVALSGDFAHFAGRVVEVVAGPFDMMDGPAELGPWFRVGAPWLAWTFPGRDVIALRRCLRPIIPPEPALAAVGKRTTEGVT